MATERLLGELRVTQQLSPYEFGVELWVIREGVNRNKWDYRNMDGCYLTFLGTPILCAYVNDRVGDGHNMEVRQDPETGESYYSFVDGTSERIVGTLSDDPKDLSIQEVDGQKWLVAKGRLFAFYAKELVDKIVRTGRMDVSAETEVLDSYEDGNTEVFTEWRGIGVTILGDGVMPAVPNARIAELAAMEQEFKELKFKAASFQEDAGSEPKEDKPQPNNEKERVNKKMNVFSKKQVAELSSKFEGFTAIGAMQDEQGIHVALMSADGATAIYTMETLNDTIVPEKVTKVNAQTVFSFGEDCELALDTCELTDKIAADLITANASLADTKEQLEKANATIEEMRTFEQNRRLQAAKDKAVATLEAFNANREMKVADNALDELNAEIEKGVFSNSVDESGNWIGETIVAEKVLAVCAKSVMELDAKAAQESKKQFSWDKFGGRASQDDGSVRALLDKYGIE